MAVGHLVVRLGVDDPPRRVAVVAMKRASLTAPRSRSASLAVMTASRIGWTNAASHCEPKPAPPAPVSRVIQSLFCRSSATVIFHGCCAADLVVDPLQQAPAIREIVGRVVVVPVAIANIDDGIETQAVQPVLVEPEQRVVADVLAHFRAAVIGAGIAPGRVGAAVVVKVDAAVVVDAAPAVEAPEIEIARSEVVVDHIEHHGDALGVRRFDEPVQALRTAQRRFHRERLRRVVAPRVIHREFDHRHDLDGVDAEIVQVGELRDDFVERARAGAGRVVERAHVHFVDHQFIPGRHHEVVARPVEIGVVDDGVAGRVDDLAGVRVLVPEAVAAVGNHELVFVADLGAGHFHRPVAVALARERIGRGAPLIKRPGGENARGEWRPDAKRDAAGIENGAHARSGRGGSRWWSRRLIGGHGCLPSTNRHGLERHANFDWPPARRVLLAHVSPSGRGETAQMLQVTVV